jgi:hypothetical protein
VAAPQAPARAATDSTDPRRGRLEPESLRVASARPATERSSRFPPVVLAGLLVMIGLLGYGLLTRPASTAPGGGANSGGAVASAGASVAASAPFVGLTILSPTDGQVVATKDVNVIGTAPPGVTITHDVSFGLDDHTTADGTGHWAMRVGLKDGENKLVFRIGDDSSTRHEIRVTYTPPSG